MRTSRERGFVMLRLYITLFSCYIVCHWCAKGFLLTAWKWYSVVIALYSICIASNIPFLVLSLRCPIVVEHLAEVGLVVHNRRLIWLARAAKISELQSAAKLAWKEGRNQEASCLAPICRKEPAE
jgi:hypothetical protein